ncbi:Histidine kinase-, DNA gyrase B-, and HSP90-like ATPase [Propionibacterium cyclohexanicum]|uniref:Histidine kinase-, DNA gyrase B-, and HSP90-like ATPase n=1 Tax=Propionibacterium cyclohexanicum TaxID=64702 RepID=A0A1H9TN84_9ACTN|nr:ATP-binding protein [Propionibacterium cyclohexanicum]SER98464.1 Histidine kinase-, DNA gyrase B-, and HSP90-like ATPase [Propionibacterium cyclohexanicum]
MSTQATRADDLLVSSNFIRAVRESGYLNIATALAELIDNSLQATATDVSVTISRDTADAFPEIVVEDNGTGMSKAELEFCLRFGGSSRFDARQSFGRFGMGLPAASLSQARRVEVTSWQSGGYESTVALDVDAIVAGSGPTLVAHRGAHSTSESGCRVRWIQCDRIEYRRLAWLGKSLHRDLGRMYRRFLVAGLNITINGVPVIAVDPMLLTTKIEGATARLAFDELQYELETTEGGTSFVKVRFATLPLQRWHHLDSVTKRRLGIVGGGGVSILRAGREIARGWHLMGRKRKENYDDWWRCEIEFEPSLDEHFGITNNKQGIRPSATLREAIEPELESIARLLNARVRQAFENVKLQAVSEASCRIAAAADSDLPVITSRGRGGAIQYRLGSDVLPMDVMFQSTLAQRTLDLTLNADHPAFAALYQPLQALECGTVAEQLRTSIELFLLSFARSAVQLERAGQPLNDLIQAWSSTYRRMLQKS